MSNAFDNFTQNFHSEFESLNKIMEEAQSKHEGMPSLIKILFAMNAVKNLMKEARQAADKLMEVTKQAAIEDAANFGMEIDETELRRIDEAVEHGRGTGGDEAPRPSLPFNF